MSDADIIYLAGFIDGEGCIGIRKYKRKGKQNYYYSMQVDVCNTNYEIIDWIVKTFGGWMCTERHPKGNRAVQFKVQFGNNRAKLLLEKVSPYLKIKHSEALLAIEFQTNLKQLSFEDRDRLYKQIAALKQSYKHFPPAETKRENI